MDVKEFYEKIGVDYTEITNRLPSEALIKRVLLKFLDDKTFRNLAEAVEKRDFQEIFYAAHTMKGITANLGLHPLYREASELTELTRNEVKDETAVWEVFRKVEKCYQEEIEAIRKIYWKQVLHRIRFGKYRRGRERELIHPSMPGKSFLQFRCVRFGWA